MVSLHTSVELLLACILIAQAWQLVLSTYALIKNAERRKECQEIEARGARINDMVETAGKRSAEERDLFSVEARKEAVRRRSIAAKMSLSGTVSGDEYARWPANVAEIIERYEAIDRKLGKPQ